MGGGPWALPPGLGHGVQGGSGGLAPPVYTTALGINSFCDRFSYVFCGFSCISQPILYTPPKTPFFPTGPANLLVVIRGFPHILLILEHKIGCFVVISMVFHCKSRCGCILYIYQIHENMYKICRCGAERRFGAPHRT